MANTRMQTPSAEPSEKKAFPAALRRRLMLYGGIGALILAAAGVYAYTLVSSREVVISSSMISAPIIELSPVSGGRLDAVYANVGDVLPAHTPVARVGTEVIETKVAGLIVQVHATLGAQIAPGQSVVEMIDPSQLRVVGKLDENKGLAQIQVGDPVTFTVDAFGGKVFKGVVDEVAPTSNQSGIVFNISNQRQTQQFDVKARFDTNAYPELKNGMSARMYVYPQS